MSYFLFLLFLISINCSEKNDNLDNNDNDKRMMESDEYSNIRILIDSKCLGSSNISSSDIFQRSINKAKNALEKLIKVKNLKQEIYLDRDYQIRNYIDGKFADCYNENLLTQGLPYDLVIFIREYSSAFDANKKIDFAISEILKFVNNDPNQRPVVGTVIYDFKLDFLDDGDDESKIEVISTIFLHEFTHILGFNKTILEKKHLILKENVKNRANSGRRDKLYVNGTNVVNKARKYFGCDSLKGVELDDFNGKEVQDGNSVHWNERILLGDYMLPELYYLEQVISEITLALLEDLGDWYKVNYYTGGLMRFGKHQGCEFINNDCIKDNQSPTGIVTSFRNEFCSKIYAGINLFGTCSSGRMGMGYCSNRYPYADINDNIDYAQYRREGLSSTTMDSTGFSPSELIEFCPFSNTDYKSNKIIYNYYGNCKIGNNRYGTSNDFVIHKYGNASFCAHASLLNKKRTNPQYVKNIIRTNCYEMSCSSKSLTIHVEDELIVCPREGGIIKIDNGDSNFEGYLICPDYNLICTGSIVCNNLFDCVEKGSIVKDSTYDYDYTINQNVSIEITSQNDASIKEADINKNKRYELGEDGVCPKDCQQCIGNKKCTICREGYIYYIGTKEGDDEEIICNNIKPTQGYYNISKNSREFYYYKCLENCITCKNASICEQCAPTHYINKTDGHCIERIPGCIQYDEDKYNNNPDNGGAKSYYECLNCNNTEDYYCLNNDRTKCVQMPGINMSLYYPMETKSYPCIQKCQDRYRKCVTCNSQTCIICNETNETNLYINYHGDCLDKIENCEAYELQSHTSACAHCKEDQNYYCIDTDRTQCQYISRTDIISYYKKTEDYNSCVKLCNETFNNTCLECNRTGCTKCQEGYFIYQGQCKLNMTGCIDNIVINQNPFTLECNNCDSNSSYYCLNEDKSKCNLMNISMYYLLPELNYSCYGFCGDLIGNCTECNSTNCFKCKPGLDVNRRKTYCLVPPTTFKEDVPCQVILKDDIKTLNSNFNFNSTVFNYFQNLDHINKVEHYKGNNYTITLYINSNCTEGLLSEGYFKLDTKEINRSFIEEGEIEYVYHTFAIYINYNYRSYLRFYDIEQNYLDPVNDCKTCLEKSYFMTHNLYNILQDIIGTQFTELIMEKNLDIFSEESPIYKDSCENLTLHDVDIPINLRKKLLFFHEYFEPLMCRDIDCQLVEYNLTNRTSMCECKIGKTFEDILNSPKFEFTPYDSDTDPKGFSEAVKVVKCLTKGIKYSSFKRNTAAIICVVIFVVQCLLYIAYGCYGDPLDENIPKSTSILANPPKSDSPTRIYLYSDWDLNAGKEPVEEEEKVIQPRDDSGDQIMEEEKSLNNDIFSNVSIDTNAGGLFNDKKTNRSLRAAEKNKKVLILLGNNMKTKKKVSIERSSSGKMSADNDESDDTPLGKRKYDNSGFCKNYWKFLSVKQHIINFFDVIPFCNMTLNYIPLTIKLIRSLFLVALSFILSILWLDQKYIQKKWEHFNDKYSLLTSEEKNISIPLSERILYALSHTIVHVIVDLIILIFADFIFGVAFFKIRKEGNEIEELLKEQGENPYDKKLKNKFLKKLNALRDKAKNKNNIFFAIVFILVVVFFISLCGFGATYPGGVVDCVTSGIFAIILLEIIPFIWSLILALFRYLGNKKKNECMKSFSEFFLY